MDEVIERALNLFNRIKENIVNEQFGNNYTSL